MSSESRKVVCSDCKTVLNQRASEVGRACCPQCGSTNQSLYIQFEEQIQTTEWVDMKLKDLSLPSSKKLRVHMQSGQQFSVNLGRHVDKTRVLDKENDRYLEKVTDPLTGEVLRHCEEPLTVHQGRGSAKFKTVPPTDASKD